MRVDSATMVLREIQGGRGFSASVAGPRAGPERSGALLDEEGAVHRAREHEPCMMRLVTASTIRRARRRKATKSRHDATDRAAVRLRMSDTNLDSAVRTRACSCAFSRHVRTARASVAFRMRLILRLIT